MYSFPSQSALILVSVLPIVSTFSFNVESPLVTTQPTKLYPNLVGVSRNTISSIETGQFSPTTKLALVLAIALNKKFEELFYF